MPSLDGFKTWLDYELLFLALGISLVAVVLALNHIMGYLESLPFRRSDATIAIMVFSIGLIVFFLWSAGRFQ